MDFNNLNYQNNNAMFQNPMMNNPYNMMMQNPMNNQPSNIMIQNSMNNGTYNMMIQNPMNYPNNIFIPIQTSNQFNGINPYQMNYQNNIYLPNQINMNNLPFNGMIQNQINFQTPKLYNEINQPIKKINYINNDIKENIPIKNSIKLDIDNNNLKELYLYPKIDFTEEELKNSKVLLVIGQTGQGKTTFINALVNIYLGINFNDKFRYALVMNENKNQLKSITKDITLYNIRPKKELNFPPLIVIDTPGFGDTSGKEEDKNILNKFKKFFESKKIINVNCILYLFIGANSRFGENDKYIIDGLLNLFGKNVKENFVVGTTNFIPESKNDIPNIIKSLSDENHFYYQNVLKKDNSSRDEVINSYWYFSSDNKIISNNNIEGNKREKEKWEYTEEQIKFFIENKIKKLEEKNLEESKNVLNNRFQLENEINSFTEKIDVLILRKTAYESNLNEQKNYKELIIKVRNKLKKNDLEKINIYQTLKEISVTLPYMKKIINSPIKTEKDNLICEKCQSNCHKSCNCLLTIISIWGCNMISFDGKCKICNHRLLDHKRGKFIYKQEEEEEALINNETEELKNYIKFLSQKQTEETFHMKAIVEDNDILKKVLSNLNNQVVNCDSDIKNLENQISLIEKEIIKALKNIKINLNFLRENALNKENRTIQIFIEDYAKNKNDNEKNIIMNLYKKYELEI